MNDISLDSLVAQTVAYASALRLRGVFLCSCDAALKRALAQALQAAKLLTASLADANLSSDSSLPPHLDRTVDARRNAQDCLVEVLVMSRCAALLSTWSHVSAAVVYFAKNPLPFFMFGEPPPTAPPAALAAVALDAVALDAPDASPPASAPGSALCCNKGSTPCQARTVGGSSRGSWRWPRDRRQRSNGTREA